MPLVSGTDASLNTFLSQVCTTSGKGTDAWQVGAALIGFFIPAPEFQWGGLVTWQIDVGGTDDANMLVTQPFCMFQLGIGKVFGNSPAITYNVFIEPQFTIYNRGDGNPNFQIFFGFNNQFRTGTKEYGSERIKDG